MKLSLIQIVEGIVALLALLAVLAFIFPLPFKAAADFLGFEVKLPGRAFTPYESSDVTVIESLNGLRCALNSVAAGQAGENIASLCPEHDPILSNASLKSESLAIAESPNPIEPTEEEAATLLSAMENIETKDPKQLENIITGAIISGKAVADTEETSEEKTQPCTGMEFGGVCVECFDVLKVSKNKETAVQQIVTETLNCWKAFQTNEYENLYCGKIGVPADFDGEISEREFCKALDNAGDLGGDLAGSGICGAALIGENYDWGIGTIKAGSAPFYLCGDNAGGNEIFITRDPANCEISRMYSVTDIGDNACVVHNFELPQKFDNSGLLHPMNWIAGYNDPDFLIYYQAFPQGADRYWHVDTLSAATIAMTVGFALWDAVPALGAASKALRSTVSKTMQEGAQEAAEQVVKQGVLRTAATNFFKAINEKGWRRTLRETFLKETFEDTYYGVGKAIAGDIAEQSDTFFKSRIPLIGKIRRLRSLLQPGYKENLVSTLETQFSSTLNSKGLRLSDDFFANFLKKEGIEGPLGMELLLDPDNYKSLRDEALNAYRKQVAREMAEQAVETNLQKLTKESTRNMMKNIKAQNFFKGFFKEGVYELNEEAIREGLEHSIKKLGALPWWRRKFLLDQSTELAQQFIDKRGILDIVKSAGGAIIDIPSAIRGRIGTARAMAELTQTATGEIVSTSSEFARQLTDDFLDAAKRAIPAKDFSSLTKLVLGGDKTKELWKGRLFPGLAEGLWENKERWASVIALFLLFNAQDAADEKYQPVGMNSLAVARPAAISKPVSFELSNLSKKFFITSKLHKHDAFYGASPCKADLIIREDLCTCSRNPVGYQHLPLAEGYPYFDAKGLELNENTLRDDDFIYDHFKKVSPKEFETFTQFGESKTFKSEQAFIDFIKKLVQKSKSWRKHAETFINISEINSAKAAIGARERMNVANFFDNMINGVYFGQQAGEGTFTSGEEIVPAARGTVFLFKDYEPYFDFDGVQIQCTSRGLMTNFMDAQRTSWSTLFGYAAQNWEEMKAELNYNPYAHPNFKIPCLTISYSRHEDWNDGINYCIDEFTYVEAERNFWFAASIVTGIAVTVLGDGPGLSIALAASGLYSGYAEEQAARQAKWPAVEDQGMKGEVPITQTTFTEAGITLTGGTA